MKYRPELGKVRRMLCERLDELIAEFLEFEDIKEYRFERGMFDAKSKVLRDKVDEEWTKLCSSIGITRTAVRTENEIAMDDPMYTGSLLEMSEATALKILVLGVP